MKKRIESLYLHFPFCKHLCNYCDFYKKVPKDRTFELFEFHQYLEDAFQVHEKMMIENGYSWGALKTLYIGGGTPSLWGIEGKEFLEVFLKKHNIQIAPDCEFTLEVNPGSWNAEILEQWESIGVNRYSLGIQSLNQNVIKYLDRVHDVKDVHETLEYFHRRNVNFSVDFMLGLPYSGSLKRDVLGELSEALKYEPNHFSVYILTVKNNYTHFEALPDEEWIEREYLEVAEFLKKNGYDHYEVSNFAKPSFASKHNLHYWKSQTVAALGPSATGLLAEDRIRYKWKTKEAKVDIELLNEAEFYMESLYMGLRSEGLDLNGLIEKNSQWKGLSSKWNEHSLVTINEQNHLKLTSKGFLLLDSLMNDIFIQKLS